MRLWAGSRHLPVVRECTPVNLGDCSFAAAADLEQIKYSIEPDPTLLGVQFTEAGGGESGLSQAKVWKFWKAKAESRATGW